jgi:cell wall assembly regulator SMI1
MAAPVAASWASISSWLALHDAAVYATLRPGASPAELAACAASIGLPHLPDDLVALLQLCDGQAWSEDAPYEFPTAPWSRLLPVADIASTHASVPQIVQMCEEEFDVDPADVPHGYQVPAGHVVGAPSAPVLAFNQRWVPFAECGNGEGGPPTLFFVDCDPPPGVPPGRVLSFGGEGDALALVAPDLAALLHDIRTAMARRAGEGDDEVGGGGGGGGGGDRHRKVLYNDGPRIWHQYQPQGM